MNWTWEGIYQDALFRSGILGQGQPVNSAMLAEAKRAASLLLDELDGDGIALPLFSLDVEFDTVSGQPKYVLGTGADASPANAIRPETILNAQIRIQPGSQPVYVPLVPVDFKDYRNIPVPLTPSQPVQYSWNPKWPQGDFYLWPTPSQVWQIRLTCKVKWIDVVGDPNDDIYAVAQLPSGYNNAFVDVLALRLAQNNRLDTDTLNARGTKARFVMSTYSWNQVPDIDMQGANAFPWNITKSGMNPP